MNQSFQKITFLFLAVSFFTAPAFALKLAAGGTELTTDPCAYPYTYPVQFDAANPLVVWIDGRDDVNYVPRIYATYLNDSSHTEYLIDINVPNAYLIRTDGRTVVYNIMDWNTERQFLRMSDINDINSPIIKDVNIPGYSSYSIDIDNGVIVYHDSGNYSSIPESIYAFHAADPCGTRYLVKEFTENEYINSNIALNGNWLSWSGQYYDDANYVWLYYLETADITDLNNPVINRNTLPADYGIEVETVISNLDASGSWLVAYGTYMGTDCVFAIHDYQDANSANWLYSILSEVAGYKEMNVRVDEPFAVWVQDDRYQPQYSKAGTTKAYSELPPSVKLMGAILFSNGSTLTSVLKDFNDPNWILNAATVSDNKVVWGADYYNYSTEEYWSDLFGDTIQMECGEKGYSLADLNHDCKVDFLDFAMFAERWLDCTDPEDANCIDGEVYSAGDNLWRVTLN